MKAFWAGLLLGSAAAGLFVYASMRSTDPVADLREAMLDLPNMPSGEAILRQQLSMEFYNTSVGMPALTRVPPSEEVTDENTLGTIYAVEPKAKLTLDMFSVACVYYAAKPNGIAVMHFALVLKDPAQFIAQVKDIGVAAGNDTALVLTSVPGLELKQFDRLDPTLDPEIPQDVIVLRLAQNDIIGMADSLRTINADGVIPLCNERTRDDDKAFLELRHILGGKLATTEELEQN
ncbi:hypothetical protein [Kordiimonas aestuarii]|uniref:hypothetical protein n=1 Tax=Kordiimonas aestuarii TaxID=1005925 RepID=UPI0021D3B2B9|nr:hypothetical protein [Kordiimonas aestuarii]